MSSPAVGPSKLQLVPISEIHLDRDNPRIRKFLEMYGDNPTPDQFYLALGAAGDDEGDKRCDFQALASLEAYVLVAQDERRVRVYRRDDRGAWRAAAIAPAKVIPSCTTARLASILSFI